MSCDVVAARARKWRFKIGVGPAKSAAMVFGAASCPSVQVCRSQNLVFTSNLLHTLVLPSVLWGAEFCSGQFPLCGSWMESFSVPAVHMKSGTGRLLTLFGVGSTFGMRPIMCSVRCSHKRPVSPSWCACFPRDPSLGHHRASCSRARVLGRRGFDGVCCLSRGWRQSVGQCVLA